MKTTPTPYQLKQKSDRIYELQIYGYIGESYWDEETASATRVVKELKDVDADEIIVCINSYGGSVSDGIAIINALSRHKAKITTRNEGVAVSMGASIFMCGQERIAHENTLFMIHAPLSGIYGNSSNLRKYADVLDKFAEAQVSLYVKAGLSEKTARGLLFDGEDHWYTSTEAETEGFVTQIIEAEADIDQSFYSSPFAMLAPATIAQRHKLFAAARMAAAPDPRIAIQGSNRLAPAEPHTNQDEETTMSTKNQTNSADNVEPNTAATAVDQKAIKAEAAKEEKARQNGIRQAVQTARLDDAFAQDLIDKDIPIDRAREMIFEKMAEQAPAIDAKVPVVEFVSSGRDRFRQDAVQGICARARVVGADRNQFSRMGFHDIARMSCEQAGIRTGSMGIEQIIKQAITHSASDFPNIFENVMHKTLLGQYNLAPHVWRKFCGVGDVSDFRAHNRYTPSTFPDLQKLNENGELKNITVADAAKESITADENGYIFNLSYKMLVNDDMGAFLAIARGMGLAAARSVENDVFTLLLSASAAGPTMSDSIALFHSSHNNIGTTAAITVASIGEARALMRRQASVGGHDFLDIQPAILLCAVEKGNLARQVVSSETDASSSNSKVKNPIKDIVEVVDTPRLTGNGWYVFADPVAYPALEVAFLNGVTEPTVMLEESFSSRGVAYRITHDYGVGALEYRSAVRNAGA